MTRTRTRSQSHRPKWSTSQSVAPRSAILLMLPLMLCVSNPREAIVEVAEAGGVALPEVKMVCDIDGKPECGMGSTSIKHKMSDYRSRNSFS